MESGTHSNCNYQLGIVGTLKNSLQATLACRYYQLTVSIERIQYLIQSLPVSLYYKPLWYSTNLLPAIEHNATIARTILQTHVFKSVDTLFSGSDGMSIGGLLVMRVEYFKGPPVSKILQVKESSRAPKQLIDFLLPLDVLGTRLLFIYHALEATRGSLLQIMVS